MPAYKKFELRCNRSTEKAVHIGDMETKEEFLQKELRRNPKIINHERLNSKSKAVIDGLNERRWTLMYLQHLATRVGQTDVVEMNLLDLPDLATRVGQTDIVEMNLSDLPDLATLSLNNPQNSLPPSLVYRPTLEAYIGVLEQRRIDAQIGNDAGWAALNTLALGLASDIRNYPEDNNIAFRVFDGGSKARFFPDRQDIRCGNWQNFDINRTPTRDEAERHITCCTTLTDYISISTSPGRTWKIASGVVESVRATQKIAVIDLRVLKRLGIAYGSTTEDLRFRCWKETNKTGTKYATKHHVLVLGWLPPRSIAGVLSMEQFKKLLGESDIESNPSKKIDRSEYEKKIDFPSILKSLYEKGASAWCKDLLKLPV